MMTLAFEAMLLAAFLLGLYRIMRHFLDRISMVADSISGPAGSIRTKQEALGAKLVDIMHEQRRQADKVSELKGQVDILMDSHRGRHP